MLEFKVMLPHTDMISAHTGLPPEVLQIFGLKSDVLTDWIHTLTDILYLSLTDFNFSSTNINFQHQFPLHIFNSTCMHNCTSTFVAIWLSSSFKVVSIRR